ncbi:soma ferritin [Episyrphus balteatus]|uniref:soma ferritin n=1 Tax=Episyrphus balteatus TaxID=286459 RepID=UPI002485BD27|nr:soma ferritin [Episyrphus balteatus]
MKFLPNLQILRRMSLLVRQNFHAECEKEINRQINMELNASYEYMALAYHFDRTDMALPGLSKWCKKCCDEEKVHAEKLMTYLNKRGGTIVLSDIEKPKFVYESVKKSMEYVLNLEKTVNQSLLQVHAVATENNDPNLCDFLESEYLQEQVDAIKEISDYIRQIERCEKELGVYVFDINFDEKK